MNNAPVTEGFKDISSNPTNSPIRQLKNLYAPSTLTIHADDCLNVNLPDVTPSLHLSTTFRYTSTVSDLIPAKDLPAPALSDAHIYSRESCPNTTRLETILETLLHAQAVTYCSGLAALHAFYVFLNPKRVAIGGGYHGSHGVLNLYSKITGSTILALDCNAEDLHKGDVIHLETPVNPTGEAFSIRKYAEKAHSRGAYLLVDSTFGPPGLQEPFSLGADAVMHSGTKYIGGHSDLLCGVLASQKEGWAERLREERTYLGSVMGSMEGWLGIRSVRTLALRVARQSENASKLVDWLEKLRRGQEDEEAGAKAVQAVVGQVHHASLQASDMEWLRHQMRNGFGPVFALMMRSEYLAKTLPSKLELFHHATSLGGVESLIEWRAMSDSTVDTRLVRVSIGIEAWEDLRDDMMRAFKALAKENDELD